MESTASGENSYNINTSDINTRLGRGGFGDVYLVTHKSTQVQYAMKVLRWDGSEIEGNEELGFHRNIEILRKLDHPLVIKFREWFYDKKDKICILTEYANDKSLDDYLQK